jgi:hypothetical protein
VDNQDSRIPGFKGSSEKFKNNKIWTLDPLNPGILEPLVVNNCKKGLEVSSLIKSGIDSWTM